MMKNVFQMKAVMRGMDTKNVEISPPSAVEKEVRFPSVHSTCHLRLGVYPKSEQINYFFFKKKKGETNVYDLLLCDIGMSDKQQGSPEP